MMPPRLTLSDLVHKVSTRPVQLDRAAARLRRAPSVAAMGTTVFGSGTGPVSLDGVELAQPDSVTCAATALLLLNASYDPLLEGWLRTGEGSPALLERAGSAPVGSVRERLQHAVAAQHRAATRASLGPFSWPRSLGTTPWGVAREARAPGLEFGHRAVDDRDEALMDAVLDLLAVASERGVPVPLYVGGDLRGGLARSVPRHMVLALPSQDPAMLRVYEPSRGLTLGVSPHDLRSRTSPHPALGNWTHVVWTLIPRPR